MSKNRQFSLMDLTMEEFKLNVLNGLKQFNFIKKVECRIEDSFPWVNIMFDKVINPENALEIMEALENSVLDEVLFNSLTEERVRFVFNAKFQLAGRNIDFEDENDYSEEDAYRCGQTKEDFKKKYNL